MKKETVFYWVVIVGLVISLFFLDKCRRDGNELNDIQQQILVDSLTVTTNELGQQTAQIGLIQTDYSTFKQVTFAKEDSLGRELQKMVTRRTISATIATQVAKIDTVFKTDTVLQASNGCDSVFKMSDSTEHRTLNIEASRDNFRVNMRLFEKLTFSQEWTKWNLFKKQSCVTKYTNSNPDVEITGLRTYTVKCDCGKKGWLAFAGGNVTGFALGMGAGYVTGKLK